MEDDTNCCESGDSCCKPASDTAPLLDLDSEPNASTCEDKCCDSKPSMSPEQKEFSQDLFVNIISHGQSTGPKLPSSCCQSSSKKKCGEEDTKMASTATVTECQSKGKPLDENSPRQC